MIEVTRAGDSLPEPPKKWGVYLLFCEAFPRGEVLIDLLKFFFAVQTMLRFLKEEGIKDQQRSSRRSSLTHNCPSLLLTFHGTGWKRLM